MKLTKLRAVSRTRAVVAPAIWAELTWECWLGALCPASGMELRIAGGGEGERWFGADGASLPLPPILRKFFERNNLHGYFCFRCFGFGWERRRRRLFARDFVNCGSSSFVHCSPSNGGLVDCGTSGVG